MPVSPKTMKPYYDGNLHCWMIQCTDCREVLPQTCFMKCKAKISGFRGRCKLCTKRHELPSRAAAILARKNGKTP